MIPNLQGFIGVGFGEEMALSLKSISQIKLLIAFLMLILLPMPALSATAHDFTGTVLKVSEPNGLDVRITESGLQGLGNSTEVILAQSLPDLSYFRGKGLQFDLVGHDIIGRPV